VRAVVEEERRMCGVGACDGAPASMRNIAAAAYWVGRLTLEEVIEAGHESASDGSVAASL
jgi:hypothetical protein